MNEQQSREAFQAGVDEALATPGGRSAQSGRAGSAAGADAELAQTLREMRREMAGLRAATERTRIPASQITSVRLKLSESPLLAGIVESPRASLLALLVGGAAVAQYLEPGILGEFVHVLEDDGNAGAFGLATAALSLLFGRYGAGKKKPVDGSIEEAADQRR